MLRRIFFLLPLSLLVMLGVKAQYKIVVIGSSTAEGSGSWPIPDSSWVGRLTKSFNLDPWDGKDTVVYNLALGGTTTYKGREIPRPEYWGGFLVRPIEVEFWQGRPNRLHDRIRYKLQDDFNWKIDRLSP